MKTEDVPLDIKEIFARKRKDYSNFEIASTRYLAKKFIEHLIDLVREGDKLDKL